MNNKSRLHNESRTVQRYSKQMAFPFVRPVKVLCSLKAPKKGKGLHDPEVQAIITASEPQLISARKLTTN